MKSIESRARQCGGLLNWVLSLSPKSQHTVQFAGSVGLIVHRHTKRCCFCLFYFARKLRRQERRFACETVNWLHLNHYTISLRTPKLGAFWLPNCSSPTADYYYFSERRAHMTSKWNKPNTNACPDSGLCVRIYEINKIAIYRSHFVIAFWWCNAHKHRGWKWLPRN